MQPSRWKGASIEVGVFSKLKVNEKGAVWAVVPPVDRSSLRIFTNLSASITNQFAHPRLNVNYVVRISDGETPMPKSVLVVDDNAFIRQALCQLFTSQADFDVCGEAANGQEAIEKAQELRPDVVVMDVSMPVMNGLDAARALKKLLPQVPIILFSEYGDAFSKDEAHSAGVSALVPKSRNVSALLGEVRRLCGLTAA